MTDADDERWLEGIAGRSAGTATAVDREAARLRAAIRARTSHAAPTDSEVEAGLQRLQLRLRREGLIGPATRARARPLAWALAASVVVALATAALYRQGLPPPAEEVEVFGARGGLVQELAAPDPARKADEIAHDLRALDITVVRRDTKRAITLEALVQNRADPRLAEVLARHGLKIGGNGPLLVRVTPTR